MPVRPRLYSTALILWGLLIGSVASRSNLALAQPLSPPPAKLQVGDPTPPFSPGKWIKGEPVTKLETGKIYVVEFWATWCGPCRTSIPHLSELQAKYPAITFIGQDSMEDDQSGVEAFVKDMGDKMNYRVVLDDVAAGSRAGKMLQTWFEPSGSEGIPTAFVVGADSKIAWIGHPMELDRVLDPIVAGTFDAKKEAAQSQLRKSLIREIGKAMQGGDFDAALAAMDKLLAIDPSMSKQINARKFGIYLSKKDNAKGYALAKELFEANKNDSELLNELAWTIVDPEQSYEKPDLALALQFADRANQITNGKSPEVLDTLAHVQAAKGDFDAAIDVENKAIALTKNGPLRDELVSTLEQYKASQKAKPTK